MEDWETESKLGGRGWEGLPEAWVSFFSLWEHMGFWTSTLGRIGLLSPALPMDLIWLYRAVTGFPNRKPAPWEKRFILLTFTKITLSQHCSKPSVWTPKKQQQEGKWGKVLSFKEDSACCLEKEMATHSSVLAWRIPGTKEPGGLPSMGSHRVGHDWSDLAAAADVAFPSDFHCVHSTSNVH